MESLQLRIEQAFEVGQQTGKARRERDESRAKFHKDWFSRFKALQPAEDRGQIQTAFDNGYSAGYGSIKPAYFR